MIISNKPFLPPFSTPFQNPFGDQAGAGSIDGTVLVNDTFTEGSDTVLSSHVPDTGTGWTQEANTTAGSVVNVIAAVDNIQLDVRGTNSHIIYSAQPDPTDRNYYVEMTLTTVDFSAGDKVFLILRYVDANNYYFFGGSVGGGTPNMKIYKVVAGTVTTLASDAVNNIVNGSIWRFQGIGTKLTAFLDTVETISATDGTFSSPGKGGIGWGNLAVALDDASVDWDLDDFSMVT